MTKNSFETIAMEYIGIDDFYFVGGYINRMAGKDLINNDNINSKYDYMYGNPLDKIGQVSFGGAMYKYSNLTNFSGYYFNINQIANVIYGEAQTGKIYHEKLRTKLQAQMSNIQSISNSTYEGGIYGINVNLGYNKYNINLGYNKSVLDKGDNIKITKGISPYYTTNDNISIEDFSVEMNAVKASISLPINKKIKIETSYSYYKSVETSDNYEKSSIDGKLNYQYNKYINADISLSAIKNEFLNNEYKYVLFSKINIKF